MIDPKKCAERILKNDPEVADSLYDLLLWVRNSKGSRYEAQVDVVMKHLYSETVDSAKHQQEHDRHLLDEPRERKLTEQAMSVH